MDAADLKDTRGKGKKSEKRLEKLRRQKVPKAAISRYLESEGIEVNDQIDDLYSAVSECLTDEQFEELFAQFRYAGRVTMNYFVFPDLGNKDIRDVEAKITEFFPSSEETEDRLNVPYLADVDSKGDKLYVVLGYNYDHGNVEPGTGYRSKNTAKRECIMVIHSERDLVEVRASDRGIAKKIFRNLCLSLSLDPDDRAYTPNFGINFLQEFNKGVKKYLNLKVRVMDQEGNTIDSIKFKSKKDENGNREDAREDDRVIEEIEDNDGEIVMGYAEHAEGHEFHLNRKQSKLSLQKYEREDKLGEITDLIHEVLKETGGYPQRTLRDIGNVPE